MTDKEALYSYRIGQASETLHDAEVLLEKDGSLRSVLNRAYYAVFYAVLALFIKFDLSIKSSKHSGVITVFDKEFIVTGLIDKKYSAFLHSLFDDRQEMDYKEFAVIERKEAEDSVEAASEFIRLVRTIEKKIDI